MSREFLSSLREQMVLPVIAAPMFLVSGPDLVLASCKSGIIGSFPVANARTTEVLDEWLHRITSELAELKRAEPARKIAPWAANIVVHRSYSRLEADLELIVKYKAPLVITALGNPGPVVERIHAYGGLVFSDVNSIHHARKAAEAGVDGLILVGAGAGGHAGRLTGFAFVDTVRTFWDGIVVLAGGISTGRGVLAARALGVDLVYMGTRFIATPESMARPEYQQMVVNATAEDIILTDAFTGVHANMLKPSIRQAGLDPDQLGPKAEINFSEMRGDTKAWRDIWSAGQGVGAIQEIQSVPEIVTTLQREYDEALRELNEDEIDVVE